MKKKITLLLFASILLLANNSTAQCDAPTNLQSSYSNNVATFNWDPVLGATDYVFEIDWAGGDWSFGEIAVTSIPYTITGLMQGGNFQWRVKANCINGTSVYTTAFFSTPCLQPFNLSTTNITSVSAVLNWQQASTVNNANTGFSVSYRLANTTNAWIQLTNIYNNPTATFFNLTGLAANTAYEWRVRRVCSAFNSDYITSQFVTQPAYCISNGSNSSLWINYFKLGTINRTSVAEPGGYATIPLSTDLVIGSNNNAGQIRTGFSGNSSNSRFMVWIDFNRNGSFSDAGERLILSNGAASISGTTIKNFTINIPATATVGSTRMRVFMIKNSGNITNPCLTGYLGETEDYTVNLITSGNFASTNSTLSKNQNESIQENKLKAISATPNPSVGLFNIMVPSGFDADRYEVVNTNGNTIQKSIVNTKGNFPINLSTQAKGMYLLVVFNKKGNKQTTKLIVQ